MSRPLIRSGMHVHRWGEQSDQAWGVGGYGREQVTKSEVTHKRGHFGSFYNTPCFKAARPPTRCQRHPRRFLVYTPRLYLWRLSYRKPDT